MDSSSLVAHRHSGQGITNTTQQEQEHDAAAAAALTLNKVRQTDGGTDALSHLCWCDATAAALLHVCTA